MQITEAQLSPANGVLAQWHYTHGNTLYYDARSPHITTLTIKQHPSIAFIRPLVTMITELQGTPVSVSTIKETPCVL